MVIATVRQQKRADELRRQRGARITQLLEQLELSSNSRALQLELHDLLQQSPVGHTTELTQDGGWFYRVAPTLNKLARSLSEATLVEKYFQCFTFPAGHQRGVLELLAQILAEAAGDSLRLEFFKRLASLVLVTSAPTEAQWLYARALDLVARDGGTPSAKAVALHVGRLSYSAGRHGRQPTIYDEQAIANDIAVREAPAG